MSDSKKHMDLTLLRLTRDGHKIKTISIDFEVPDFKSSPIEVNVTRTVVDDASWTLKEEWLLLPYSFYDIGESIRLLIESLSEDDQR